MKISENGVIRDMTPEEIAAMEGLGMEPVRYDTYTSMESALRLLVQGKTPESDGERIACMALYPDWQAGAHTAGEIYTALEQVWECFQSYDNAVYPDITPGGSAWGTFNRPLHGTTRETAREFVHPTGAHDIYKAGEYMIFAGKLYLCLFDTAYSPAEYASTWEEKV